MPQLSWNEIRQRAILFARNWEGVSRERAEAQTFWNEFFDVFGVRRRTVAAFEEHVKSLKDSYGFIDLFWKGRLLAEHKSAGASLDKAQSQAFQYLQDLTSSGRENELPRYIIVSDFARIVLYDLEPEEQGKLSPGTKIETHEIQLADLHKHIRLFAFITGQKIHRFREEDPANIEAAQIMADIHDAVETSNYETWAMERLMVRLLFCLFAEDTGIFEPAQFELYIANHTRPDGSDLGQALSGLFDVLNTPEDRRSTKLEEDLAAFPFINGDLFGDRLPLAGFDRAMCDRLVAAFHFDWSRISPAVFGSLFQGILDPKERRQIGAHYTSERDIMKLIRPLFLDELQAEFKQIHKDKSARRKGRLIAFQQKLAKLKLLDPACGCGNFLVIAYRELRRLELAALKEQHPGPITGEIEWGELTKLSHVDVDQFHGIEIIEWPSRIAETALWLTDHQMNVELGDAFGNVYQRIPLRASPHIRCANALRIDWNDVLPAGECSYVLGNPPFVGKQFQTADQKRDMKAIAGHIQGGGVLDYVCCWYLKTMDYIENRQIICAFVSTNSITQGEQVIVLWSQLMAKGVQIHFAHRTFSWQSEAKGKAHVHVVILGFSKTVPEKRIIYDYTPPDEEPHATEVSRINPYLVDAPLLVIQNRTGPICDVPPMNFGSMPNDGGFLLLDAQERSEVLKKEPNLRRWIRRFVGSKEYINGIERYCFWLVDAPPALLRSSAILSGRIASVRRVRAESKRETTRELAKAPALFGEIRQPAAKYIVVPEVSSERRTYIPIGFLPASTIAGNLVKTVPNARPFHFGVLTSAMHMAWMRQVCGRLESRYRYSAKLVYNNFPWPVDATEAQKDKVEVCAQTVLDVRKPHLDGGSCLADLYDPLYMPGDLLKAHQALDRAVDRCYRKESFGGERERVEFLFQLYEQLTCPLAPSAPPKKTRRRRTM